MGQQRGNRRFWRGVTAGVLWASVATVLGSCQSYQFVFQPDSEQRGTTLDFVVQTPSQADILFVIDNSVSMQSKQTALANSINQLLTTLAPQATSYRIGITSTDGHGYEQDCNGNTNPAVPSNVISNPEYGAFGNCERPDVTMLRPHDGTMGRLIAAFDPTVFTMTSSTFSGLARDANNPYCQNANAALTSDANCPNPVFAARQLMPVYDSTPLQEWPQGRLCDPNSWLNDPNSSVGGFDTSTDPNWYLQYAQMVGSGTAQGNIIWPYGQNCDGPRWVLDRDVITVDACNACNCTTPCTPPDKLEPLSTCYEQCIGPVSQAMVQAYFLSNMSGLGTSGWAWEEGLKSALYAVGIDPGEPNDTVAINPAYNINNPNTPPGQVQVPNVFTNLTWDDSGVESSALGPWTRPDALMAILVLSDEQDCSMPVSLMAQRASYETTPDTPEGSICYQTVPQAAFFDTTRMATLLSSTKQDSVGQIAVGLIGGVTKTNTVAGAPYLNGTPTDCIFDNTAAPSNDCACFANPEDGNANIGSGWCLYSQQPEPQSPNAPLPFCNAFAGSRYVDFVDQFQRRTYESICRNDSSNGAPVDFGPALQDFASIATLSCFELKGTHPYNDNPNDIQVTLTERVTTSDPAPQPQTLPMTNATSRTLGWYYDPPNNRICITGRQRLIGDAYEIFVFETNYLDFTQ